MRATAARKGKKIPSRQELAFMVEQTRLICCGCQRKMNWLSKEGPSSVVSLQHNRDGSMAFLCRACNTKHAQFPGDMFYTIPKSHHRCGDCYQILPRDNFWEDRSRPLGIKAYCKACARKRHKDWSDKNRELINERQRQKRKTNSISNNTNTNTTAQ
jgi:hypothetical protein